MRRHLGLFIILIVTFNVKVVVAGDNDTPIQLFTCTIPTAIMDIDVSGVQRGSEYEIIEGSNLSHPAGTIKIEKPVFKTENTKCLFSFKKGDKEIFIDKNKGEIFTSAKTLGTCTFSKILKGCDSIETNKSIPAPPKKRKSIQ